MRFRRWLVPTLIVLAASLLLAALETGGLVLRRMLQGREAGWLDVARREVVIWVTFGALAPLAAWMARRFPVRLENWKRRLPLYVIAGPLFCIAHLVLVVVGHGLVGNNPAGFAPGVLGELFGYYVAVEACIFWAITGTFMLVDSRRETRDRALAAARLEAALSEARLRALRAQLQPHFLFNTLNAISVLAMKGDGPRVVRALGQLADLLRATLDDDLPQEIPLARELEFLERYVAIQCLRFPDRLEVVLEIEPAARDALVPAFLLQPLVENAVQHGVGAAAGGRIGVRARREGECLVVEVRDEGPGFSSAARDGVGLANTRARLAELYGPGQSLRCVDAPGGGRVEVRLPLRAAPEREALA